MQRYFVDATAIKNDSVTITGPDVHHIRDVMRLSVGAKIGVCPNDGSFHPAIINSLTKTEVRATIITTTRPAIPPIKITIAQALIRKEHFELFLEKATELGVAAVIPTCFDRSIIKIDKDSLDKKLLRYRKIVKEASEQSERTTMPRIGDFTDLRKVDFAGYDKVYFAYERCQEAVLLREVIPALPKDGNILFLIGPEGGITEAEATWLKAHGALPVSLGKRILRSETAGLMILSAFLYAGGE